MASSTPLPTFDEPPRQPTNWLLWGLLAGGLVVLAGLAFLLPATFSKPTVVQIVRPAQPQPATPEAVPAGALTILLAANHRLYYYTGPNTPAAPPVLHAVAGTAQLRQLLLAHQRQGASPVLLKPSPQATYQDVATMLDEMRLTGQEQYALADLTPADQRLLAAGVPPRR